jgi:PadR family transcriptional regulator, regulatory protein AphA
MDADRHRNDALSPTSYALLGQLALRPWSVYEMTRNVGRTLHWFWPRAESVLYDETKRLATLGLATTEREPGRRGRPRTVYAITAEGRDVHAGWLAMAPGGSTLHDESLLRVHLAPYGTKEDLVRAIEAARDRAEALLRQAIVIGTEFAEERHQFQDQVHIRGLLFDALWTFGLGMYFWAERSLVEVARWTDIDGDDPARRRAVERIRERLELTPGAIEPPSPPAPPSTPT